MFNPIKYTRNLEAVGLSRDQAEAHIQIIADVIENDVATKQDLKDLELRLIIKIGVMFSAIVTFALATVLALSKLI